MSTTSEPIFILERAISRTMNLRLAILRSRSFTNGIRTCGKTHIRSRFRSSEQIAQEFLGLKKEPGARRGEEDPCCASFMTQPKTMGMSDAFSPETRRSGRVCRNRIPPRGTDEERAGWGETKMKSGEEQAPESSNVAQVPYTEETKGRTGIWRIKQRFHGRVIFTYTHPGPQTLEIALDHFSDAFCDELQLDISEVITKTPSVRRHTKKAKTRR